MPGPVLGTGNAEINEAHNDSEQSYGLPILGYKTYAWHSQNAGLGQDFELKGGREVVKSDFLVSSCVPPIGTKSLEPKGTRWNTSAIYQKCTKLMLRAFSIFLILNDLF